MGTCLQDERTRCICGCMCKSTCPLTERNLSFYRWHELIICLFSGGISDSADLDGWWGDSHSMLTTPAWFKSLKTMQPIFTTCTSTNSIVLNMLHETYDLCLCKRQGPLTYAGRKRSTVEHLHCLHRGKQSLDIHRLKAEWQAALPLESESLGLPMVGAGDATAPEWVTYEFRTAHPIIHWLSLKLAEWLSETIREELAIPVKKGAWYHDTVANLNSIMANNLVPRCPTGMTVLMIKRHVVLYSTYTYNMGRLYVI
jgi:hypothetical protein